VRGAPGETAAASLTPTGRARMSCVYTLYEKRYSKRNEKKNKFEYETQKVSALVVVLIAGVGNLIKVFKRYGTYIEKLLKSKSKSDLLQKKTM